jgi:hypothetical protein
MPKLSKPDTILDSAIGLIEEYLDSIIEANSQPVRSGTPDETTLDPKCKPDVRYRRRVLVAMRSMRNEMLKVPNGTWVVFEH